MVANNQRNTIEQFTSKYSVSDQRDPQDYLADLPPVWETEYEARKLKLSAPVGDVDGALEFRNGGRSPRWPDISGIVVDTDESGDRLTVTIEFDGKLR